MEALLQSAVSPLEWQLAGGVACTCTSSPHVPRCRAQVFLGGAAFSSATFAWNASSSTVEADLEQQLGYDISVARASIREGLYVGLSWTISHKWQLKDNTTDIAARAASDVPAFAAVTSALLNRRQPGACFC